MKLKQIEDILIQSGIEKNEAKIEAKMLVKHFCKLTEVDLAINDEFKVPEILLEKVKIRAERRVPIQHLIGTAYFMGEDFIVNENVLIPRDETEILVRKAIELIKENEFKKVLDIGTGSGCIACMVAKLADTQVVGVDISNDALQTALDNSSKLGLFNKAIFRKSDIFSNVREKFDIIISNPPYIPLTEKNDLQIEVSFEPDSALFASDIDGVEFYEKIIKGATEFLTPGGYVVFEIGIKQAELVKDILIECGFCNIGIEKDLAGIERVIWGKHD